jgi:hypothetical protein
VCARASTDRKGFITGLRHHFHGCPRPRSYTNFPSTNQPTNQRSPFRVQALKRFRAGHDGLATFLTPIVAQSCFNVFNVHTEIKLILILILICLCPICFTICLFNFFFSCPYSMYLIITPHKGVKSAPKTVGRKFCTEVSSSFFSHPRLITICTVQQSCWQWYVPSWRSPRWQKRRVARR